jgi:predicted transcriptional regulator
VKKKTPKPTAGELEILHVLWRIGPATVRSVHDELSRRNPTGYTTVLKLMQIMTGKGLLDCDARERAHVFRPAMAKADTERQIVSDVVERVFGGSASQLVMRALADRPASKIEIEEIRQMLDSIEKGESE